MAHPGRNNIYEAAIRRMVKEALEEQEKQFQQEHDTDTDTALLAYLQSCAHRLGYSPWPGEIIGGRLIEARFGSWNAALDHAGLAMPSTPNRYHSFARVQEEVERQKAVYRQKKAEKKVRAQRRKTEQRKKERELV